MNDCFKLGFHKSITVTNVKNIYVYIMLYINSYSTTFGSGISELQRRRPCAYNLTPLGLPAQNELKSLLNRIEDLCSRITDIQVMNKNKTFNYSKHGQLHFLLCSPVAL